MLKKLPSLRLLFTACVLALTLGCPKDNAPSNNSSWVKTVEEDTFSDLRTFRYRTPKQDIYIHDEDGGTDYILYEGEKYYGELASYDHAKNSAIVSINQDKAFNPLEHLNPHSDAQTVSQQAKSQWISSSKLKTYGNRQTFKYQTPERTVFVKDAPKDNQDFIRTNDGNGSTKTKGNLQNFDSARRAGQAYAAGHINLSPEYHFSRQQ